MSNLYNNSHFWMAVFMATETIIIVDSDVKISSGAERRKIAVSLSAHPLTT